MRNTDSQSHEPFFPSPPAPIARPCHARYPLARVPADAVGGIAS